MHRSLDAAVQQHSARQPGSPLVLVPTTSHTVDFAALQLCSLQSFADPLTAALAVCWDRSAFTALHTARLPAVLDETATYEAVQAEAKARMAKKAIAQRRHDPDTFVPGSVFLPNGRALQWLKFYLLRRVSALLAHTGTPVFVVDSDVLWLQPAARALTAPCTEEGLDVAAMVDGGNSAEYVARANAGAILSCDTAATRRLWRDTVAELGLEEERLRQPRERDGGGGGGGGGEAGDGGDGPVARAGGGAGGGAVDGGVASRHFIGLVSTSAGG